MLDAGHIKKKKKLQAEVMYSKKHFDIKTPDYADDMVIVPYPLLFSHSLFRTHLGEV